jgi:REP element-mobilizing transposase RayT
MYSTKGDEMVIGYHVVMSMYGFWLPNDPRGSGSVYVASRDLYRYGPARHVKTRRSVAATPHDRQLRLAAKSALKHPSVELDGYQARAIARGFAKSIEEDQITCWACAILPHHLHLVLGRHSRSVEWIVMRLKRAGTRQLIEEKRHPFQEVRTEKQTVPPSVWSRGHRQVFLNSSADVYRDIRYVEQNPIREGKRRQLWPFVTPYEPPEC